MHELQTPVLAWSQIQEVYPTIQTGVPWENTLLVWVVVLVLTLLGFQYLNHRRRLAEMRLKTLESLARQGQLRPDDVERLVGADRGLPKGLLIAAWVAMLVGLLFVILSKADFRFDDLFFPGALVAVVGLGLISAPFLIRELKRDEGRQG